jgi:hypothetical protein
MNRIPATRIKTLYLVKGLSPLAIKKLATVIREPRIKRNIYFDLSYTIQGAK